jgi:hypothetical protein
MALGNTGNNKEWEMSILATCYDRGASNNVGPVVKALRSRGVEVNLFAGGPATAALERTGVRFIPFTTARLAIAADRKSTLLYAGVDSNDRLIGYEVASEMLKAGISCPVALQSDFWGSGIYHQKKWSELTPIRHFVNDRYDAKLAERVFPKMHPRNIRPISWPWLDNYHAGEDEIKKRGARFRQTQGIPEGMPTVFYAGQLGRTAEVATSLIRAIIGLDQPVCLIGRLHPIMLREESNWADETSRYNEAIAEFQRWGKGKYILGNDPLDPKDLIAAATVVVSMFSTVLIEAAAWRRQNIAMLYPEVGMAEWLVNTGEGIIPEFPLVSLGCTARAANDEETASLLADCYTGQLRAKLEPNQEKHINATGGNAERIADELASLI